MVDDNRIIALKQRRGFFAASGLREKAKAIDVEIARLRGIDDLAPPEPDPAPAPEPAVETAAADLTGVETAAVRRRGRPPRQG